VFFTSDNGPWLEEGVHGGSAGLLRGGKAQNWEGGIRVPGVVWGPGLGVRAGRVSRALASTMDIVPTVAEYVGAPAVATLSGRLLDGRSLRSVLVGDEKDVVSASSRVLFHYCGFTLHAMRYGPYKAYFHTPRYTDPLTSTCNHGPGEDVHVCGCIAGLTSAHWPPLMYDLDADPSERTPMDPVSHAAYASTLATILRERALHERTLVTPRSQIATPAIPALQPCCNSPACRCTEPVA
jgi:steryl-sulfatase